MLPTINNVSKDIKNVSVYLRSVKKWGKSTLFRDVIRQKYGDLTKGCLVECGMERGDSMLNMNTTHLNTYTQFKAFKEWLINEKGKSHNIEIVCFDTADEMIPAFEAETIRINNRENPQKPVKSIKAAMGGYNAGVEYTASLIKKYIDDIIQAGFGVWVIAHTKFKTIREKGGLEEDGYMQLTSNLANSYESAFGDILDCTLTGVIDRVFDEKLDSKKNTKKYTTDSIRKLYFRGTTLIDAGGRFASDTVPEYMEYDCSSKEFAKRFIDTIENALNDSAIEVPKSDTFEVPKCEPQPEPESDFDDIEPTDDIDIDIESLRDEIRKKAQSAGADVKNEIRAMLKEAGVKLVEADYDTLIKISKMF